MVKVQDIVIFRQIMYCIFVGVAIYLQQVTTMNVGSKWQRGGGGGGAPPPLGFSNRAKNF